jgi:hypothetical protein
VKYLINHRKNFCREITKDLKGLIRSEMFRSEVHVSSAGWILLVYLLRWTAVILSDFMFDAIIHYRFIFHLMLPIQGKIRRMNSYHYKTWCFVFWELNAMVISLLEKSTTGLVFVLRMRCTKIDLLIKKWFSDEVFFRRWL